ncbi:MAG: hypothetical protein KAV99_07770 [Candidatus Latescibacteria bacterium]|nr:hypothetical protein [Candidatus Latescibacterota bacterium]
MMGFDALSEETKEFIREKMRETRRALTDALALLETAKPEECTEKALNIEEIVKALVETKTLPEAEELYLFQWQGIILGELQDIQKCLQAQEFAAARRIIRNAIRDTVAAEKDPGDNELLRTENT